MDFGTRGEELYVRPEVYAEGPGCLIEDIREGRAEETPSVTDCLLRLYADPDSPVASWNARDRGVNGDGREPRPLGSDVLPLATPRKVKARAILSAGWPSPTILALGLS